MTVKVIVDEDTGEIKSFAEKKVADIPPVEHGEVMPPKTQRRLKVGPHGSVKTNLADKARKFISAYGCNLAWQAGSFMAETPGGWVDVTDELTCKAHRFLGSNARREFIVMLADFLKVPEVASCSRATLYYERVTEGDRQVWKPFYLNKHEVMLTDGIYDILSDELRMFNGRVIYGPRVSMPWLTSNEEPKRCEEFEAMVGRALPDPEIRGYFQEVIGGVLQPHVILRGQIILWGPPGSAKTTLATAIGCSVAGATGVSFIQEAELVKSKWSAAGLLNKFVNISDDSPIVRGWPGFLKSYTSGNLRLEVKFQQPFRAPATAKLISTCNELQDSADASGAMVDRMIPFEFAQRIAGKWDTEKMTVEYWSDPERREGVVNWLLDGLIRLRERGEYIVPKQWKEAKQEAVNQADPLEAWLRENIEVGTGEIKRDDLVSRVPADLVVRTGLDFQLSRYMGRLFNATCLRKRDKSEKFRIYSGVCWVE